MAFVLFVLTRFFTSNPFAISFGSCASSPRKFGSPAASDPARLAPVALARLALSAMFTSTVRMSPTCAARWSLKNARLPERQRLFTWIGTGSGRGIGIDTGRQFGSCTGLLTGDSSGGRPTSASRDNVPQPDSASAEPSSQTPLIAPPPVPAPAHPAAAGPAPSR